MRCVEKTRVEEIEIVKRKENSYFNLASQIGSASLRIMTTNYARWAHIWLAIDEQE
jgi:hypothetical protein